MAQLFVSHSSADNALAAEVQECLADLGYESVFLDFDPTGGLVPGQAWRDQLFENLDACEAVVFLTTPKSNASQWCHSELALTRWLRKPILALLVDGCAPHPLTEDLQGLHVTSDALDRDRVRSALTAIGLEQEARWDASRSPFPGLRAFDESYAAVFFGRDRQIDQLRQLVDPPSRSHDGTIVPVLGPSGSGKSSLVRAGLVPALRVSPDWVITDPWTPSDVPLAAMSLALAHAAKTVGADLDADRCHELLRTPGGMADYVRQLREAGHGSAETKVLVVVDQAEELVSITPDAERHAFLEALTTSCAAPSPLRVVMTARTDMWDRVATETGKFAMSVAPTVLHVPPLTRADLAEVISEPARRSHLTLEDGLVQRLVDDTGSGEALPLLAFTLARLAADADDDRLTHAEYDAIGGVRGAIASRSAEVATTGGRTEEQVAEAILHLVSLTDDTPHKRLARAADVPPKDREILDDLVDARLVVINEVNGQQVYAPAHESLFSAWPPLVTLIDNRRDDLVLRARLDRRAADWKDAGATASGLLSGLELEQAREWQARSARLAGPDVVAYVAASGERQRRTRLVRASIAALAAALVAALVVTLLVNSRTNHRLAETSKQRAADYRVAELVAVSLAQQTNDPVAAAIALVEGLSIDPDSARLRSQAKALLAAPGRDVLRTEGATVVAGGPVALTAGSDDTTVWNLLDGTEVGTLPRSGATALRPDGRVAVVTTDAGLEAYDLGGGAPTELATFGSPATTVVFSPDGAILMEVTGSQVLLWDLRDPTTPRPAATWSAPPRPLNAVAVLDDGTVLASSREALLMSWAGLDGGRTTTIQRNQDPNLNPAVIVPDAAGSRALVSGPSVSTGQPLVDLRSGRVLQSFKASGGEFEFSNVLATTWTSAMDPAGERVVAFDLAGRGFLFAAQDGAYLGPLLGHGDLVQRVQFTSDGRLFSGGLDGTVRTWDPHSADIDTSGSLSEALCAAFGEHMDADSWTLAMGKRAFESPCPGSAPAPEPAPLSVPSSVLEAVNPA